MVRSTMMYSERSFDLSRYANIALTKLVSSDMITHASTSRRGLRNLMVLVAALSMCFSAVAGMRPEGPPPSTGGRNQMIRPGKQPKAWQPTGGSDSEGSDPPSLRIPIAETAGGDYTKNAPAGGFGQTPRGPPRTPGATTEDEVFFVTKQDPITTPKTLEPEVMYQLPRGVTLEQLREQVTSAVIFGKQWTVPRSDEAAHNWRTWTCTAIQEDDEPDMTKTLGELWDARPALAGLPKKSHFENYWHGKFMAAGLATAVTAGFTVNQMSTIMRDSTYAGGVHGQAAILACCGLVLCVCLLMMAHIVLKAAGVNGAEEKKFFSQYGIGMTIMAVAGATTLAGLIVIPHTGIEHLKDLAFQQGKDTPVNASAVLFAVSFGLILIFLIYATNRYYKKNGFNLGESAKTVGLILGGMSLVTSGVMSSHVITKHLAGDNLKGSPWVMTGLIIATSTIGFLYLAYAVLGGFKGEQDWKTYTGMFVGLVGAAALSTSTFSMLEPNEFATAIPGVLMGVAGLCILTIVLMGLARTFNWKRCGEFNAKEYID